MRTIPSPATRRLRDLAEQYVRTPTEIYDEDGVSTLVFDPPLTAQEQATLDLLKRLAGGPNIILTPADLVALEPRLATGRAWLALNQSTFRGMTENASRDATLDSVSALWRVIFRLLREL